MKKKTNVPGIIIIMAIALIVLVSGGPRDKSEDKVFGEYEYIILDDNSVSITGYIGQEQSIQIPRQIEGRVVRRIEKDAFNTVIRSCVFTEVTIPETVTEIGEGAFSRCSRLRKITIGDSVKVIEYSAFYECTGLTEITIPDSVTEIGPWAFRGCTGLTKISIPGSVTKMGEAVFVGSNLESIYCETSEKPKEWPDDWFYVSGYGNPDVIWNSKR